MLKDEQNRYYNDGGDAIPLKIWSDFSSLHIINLRLMSDNTQSYREYLPRLIFPLLYCALYKPSDQVGLMKKALTVC